MHRIDIEAKQARERHEERIREAQLIRQLRAIKAERKATAKPQTQKTFVDRVVALFRLRPA